MAISALKKLIGVLLILLGLLALVTPLTPGAWLIFVGLEILGVRLLFWTKLKDRLFGKKQAEDREDRK